MRLLKHTVFIIFCILAIVAFPGCTPGISAPASQTDTMVENTSSGQSQPGSESLNESTDTPSAAGEQNNPPETPLTSEPAPEAPEAAPAAPDSQAASVLIPRDIYLKYGNTGSYVVELQIRLNKFNYNLAVDGDFGYMTDFALRDFQTKTGIGSDGIAGPVTWSTLESTPAQTPYLFDEAVYYQNIVNSSYCPSSTGYFIYVNLKRHAVVILTGSSYNWTTSKIFTCTVGTYATPTVTGRYTVGAKGSYFVVKENGLICKYYTQITGDYLFHSILYYPSGGIADARLGMNLSHGCIRLATENAYYIYTTIPRGTAIWIQ